MEKISGKLIQTRFPRLIYRIHILIEYLIIFLLVFFIILIKVKTIALIISVETKFVEVAGTFIVANQIEIKNYL